MRQVRSVGISHLRPLPGEDETVFKLTGTFDWSIVEKF